MKHPRIVITPGEPAGIGPDITIKAILRDARFARFSERTASELTIVADPDLLIARAKQLQLTFPLEKIKIIPVPLNAPCTAGKLNVKNASYVMRCLEIATDYCLENNAALVTGPVHKGIMNEANIQFTGHTEFLAKRCTVSEVIMLFVTENMKVALVTTHLPLKDVSKNISSEKIYSMIRLLKSELQKKFLIVDPKILISGLNPHAGERGFLGREEIEIIEPALKKLRDEKIQVTGPLPADTLFTEKYIKQADVIVAMYHDQALPVVKYAGFGHAINVTLGLPIIRTSVDHGTALDIAGTPASDSGSLEAAIDLAFKLLENQKK
jgi:4-hydroxythreonine-4-phosphate dehydrogenase